MARSYRHTPIFGFCSYGSRTMKRFRALTAKRLRQATAKAIALASADFDQFDVLDPRVPSAVVQRYSAPDDGRHYVSVCPPEFLRK